MKSKFAGLNFDSVEVLTQEEKKKVKGGNGGYPSFIPSQSGFVGTGSGGGSGGGPSYPGPPSYGGGEGGSGSLPPTTIGGVTCPGGTHVYNPNPLFAGGGYYTCG